MKTVDMDLSEDNGPIEFSCLEVNQPLGTFYIGSIKCKELIRITYSDVRRMENDERAMESYLGVQRPLSKKRAVDISKYTNTVDSSFPTSIILSVSPNCVSYDQSTKKMVLTEFDGDDKDQPIVYKKIARVIDGQHRIAGLEGFTGKEFDINVSIFVGIDVASEAYIFSTVNLAQTKVSKSLAYDLFDLARTRSPQKVCHQIAVTLNNTEGSPFKNRIKRLGTAVRESHASSITQAAFVQTLIKLMSKDEMLDRDCYMRGKKPTLELRDNKRLIFRHFLIEENDFELTDMIWSYFSAVSKRWPTAWAATDQGLMLAKTNGFMALMRFFKDIYIDSGQIGEVLEEKYFEDIFKNMAIEDDEFTVEKHKPGSSGAGTLYQKFKENYTPASA